MTVKKKIENLIAAYGREGDKLRAGGDIARVALLNHVIADLRFILAGIPLETGTVHRAERPPREGLKAKPPGGGGAEQ